ncbi:MAG TPA: fatty acid desaturase [Rhizomicrobium sp.]|jgi:omega-6 fatty acid desaturase (delta-12 desaturase)|nr:fatty acid desaturase [Rhizomicrobium sp.]
MIDPKTLFRALLAYREPDQRRALFELAITAVSLVLLWVLMWLSLKVGYWLTLLLAIPAAGFLVRLFLIQHDCGHGAFFRGQALNDWVGRLLGVLTLTPYDYWKRNHAAHHATSSNLDRRGIGDIDTLTVEEYRARPLFGRIAYRLYRNAIVMFGIGAAYMFLLQHRLPFHQMRAGWRPWVSTMATNAAIALGIAVMMWLVGIGPFLLVHLPIMLLAASMGVWLFYVQHQFEDVMWVRGDNWVLQDAALTGSSYYDLPGVLHWFTANIGIHHVHHMNSRIPYYRLQEVLRDHPELKKVGRLTFLESLRSVRLTLWCETRKKLVSFSEVCGNTD